MENVQLHVVCTLYMYIVYEFKQKVFYLVLRKMIIHVTLIWNYMYMYQPVSLSRGLGQLMGVVHNRTHARTQQKERKLLVAYVETGTTS